MDPISIWVISTLAGYAVKKVVQSQLSDDAPDADASDYDHIDQGLDPDISHGDFWDWI